MADAEKIIFKIDFDQKEADKRAVELKKSIAAVTQANKELAESFKTGKLTQDAYTKATYENDKSLKTLNVELAGIQRSTQLVEKFQNSQVGSNNQLKASILLLTDAYDKLSKEEKDNVDVGGALQKQIKGLSDELKASKSAIGDNRLEVGNYKSAIKDAFSEMGLYSDITAKATALQEGFNKAQIIAKAAMGGTTNALGLFKLALASTGIGLIVLALGSLVTFLTQSQKGIDFVNTKLAGLKTIVAVVTTQLSDFGELLFDAFDNPKQAVKDLAETIQTNLINRVKAFAVLWDAVKSGDMKKFNDGLIQVATGITDATDKTANWAISLNNARKAGEEIEKENIRIAKEERNLNVERANSKALVEQLKFIAEDTNKTIGERIQATKQAFDIEQQSINALIKLQKERIANIEREQSLSNNKNEDDQKLAEEKKKLAELVEGSTTRQIELNNKLNSLNAEAAKLAEERRQLEADFADFKKRMNDAIAINDRQAAADSLKRAIDRAGKELDIEKNRVKARLDLARKAVDERVAQEQREADEKERIRRNDLAKEQAKYQALLVLGDGLISLNEIIAGNTAEAASFQKAITLFQIGVNAALAVSNAVASAKGLTGIDYIIQIAPGIAAALAGIAQARQLLEEAGDPPRPEFYEGGEYGYTSDGNPREESKALGNKPYTYHKRELIASDAALSTPEGALAGNILMRIMGKVPKFNVPGFFNGGIADGGFTARAVSTSGNNQADMVNGIVNGVANAIQRQNIIVKVSDLNRVNASQKANVAKAQL